MEHDKLEDFRPTRPELVDEPVIAHEGPPSDPHRSDRGKGNLGFGDLADPKPLTNGGIPFSLKE